jgi:hypothetical protein
MSIGMGSPTNQARYAVFHAATNIYAIDYRRFSHVANQMEPFAEMLRKRILDSSQQTQKEEYTSFEAEYAQFQNDWQHTAQLASVLADLAYAYDTLLPVGDELDVEVQSKITRMKQGKTNILVLNAEVEILKGKMEAGCLKIKKLMRQLQSKMDGWEDIDDDDGDLISKTDSPPKFFTFLQPSSSSSSSSTSTSSHMSPTYELSERVTEDIHDTLMDKFDLEKWKKEAEELRKLEEESADVELPAFSPEPTPRSTPPLQEPSHLSLQPLPETPSSSAEMQQPQLPQNVSAVSDRVQKLLTEIDLLMQRDALLQKTCWPIQTKPRTPPLAGSLRSISAPASTNTSRRSSLTLSIKKPVNPKIVTLPSPEQEKEIFTAKEEEMPKSTITDPDPMPLTVLSDADVTTTPPTDVPSMSTLTGAAQYPLSFIAQQPSPPQSPKKLHPSPLQKTREDFSDGIIKMEESERVVFPKTTKKLDFSAATKKPDRSCGVSFVEWWKSCFTSRKVTDLDMRS